MRSVLRRIYCTAVDAATYAPVLQKLRFQILPQAQVELDGRPYHSAMLDFGPDLFSGWLTSLVGLELGVEQEEMLDEEARELVLDGQRISTSQSTDAEVIELPTDTAAAGIPSRARLVWSNRAAQARIPAARRLRSMRSRPGCGALMSTR